MSSAAVRWSSLPVPEGSKSIWASETRNAQSWSSERQKSPEADRGHVAGRFPGSILDSSSIDRLHRYFRCRRRACPLRARCPASVQVHQVLSSSRATSCRCGVMAAAPFVIFPSIPSSRDRNPDSAAVASARSRDRSPECWKISSIAGTIRSRFADVSRRASSVAAVRSRRPPTRWRFSPSSALSAGPEGAFSLRVRCGRFPGNTGPADTAEQKAAVEIPAPPFPVRIPVGQGQLHVSIRSRGERGRSFV